MELNKKRIDRILMTVVGNILYAAGVNLMINPIHLYSGGFTGIADREWLNLAETLRDGQKLKILTLEEAQIQRNAGTVQEPGMDDGELSAAKEDAASGGRVNLNTATREELMTLPGIGEAKAEAVIRYREEHGTFQTVEEIMQISGIKDAIYMKIKDRLTV